MAVAGCNIKNAKAFQKSGLESDRAGRSTGKHGGRKARIFASPPQFDIARRPADPSGSVGSGKTSIDNDWRAGQIVVQSIDMLPSEEHERHSHDAPPAPRGKGSDSTGAAVATDDLRNPDSTSAGTTRTTSIPISKRITSSPGNASTRARFEPSHMTETEVGYGVVRLYREAQETPELYGDGHYGRKASRVHTPAATSLSSPGLPPSSSTSAAESSSINGNTPFREEDCTTLCVLAVPSYFSPTRFLSWVGDATRDEVSHFRMLRTDDPSSRYMVLMRFRSSRRAREWRREWNGSPFDNASPEIAQVVFVRSVELMPDENPGAGASFPDMAQDPFRGGGTRSEVPTGVMTPATATSEPHRLSSPAPNALGLKPPAPPTPSLIEMPTCPVCLERMDESSGLLTILCQHVFHCSCLYKWRGIGCPVCRFTHSGLSGRKGPGGQLDEDNATGPNECSICRSEANLWICLVCGNIGCGRYDAAHAFLHWQHSGHAFSMDMTNQRIWDYESDAYVHRIVQNKLDGKFTTSTTEDGNETGDGRQRHHHHHDAAPSSSTATARDYYDDGDYVPREKTEAIGREYTALLTSQLESQRAYYEEKVSAAADKASQAAATATEALEAAAMARSELTHLRDAHNALAETTVPALERERDRAARRAESARDAARRFEREWRDEKTLAEGLHARVAALDVQMADLAAEKEAAERQIAEQADVIRDLQFFISGQQKLAEMQDELGEDLAEGTVALPPSEQKKKAAGSAGKTAGKRARKGKGKAKAKEMPMVQTEGTGEKEEKAEGNEDSAV